ncbi:triose-phosphate isomerase [Aureimonas fodinaquatilis]|uniref:Triosephosphate isomerase n=1 Tax=Aureimonas fodinaquatilis TaxID=2565783 RepID=A0A5B0DVU6_9HYPH|nr:triose-phosphate isomerase [Aureimonas fodinaquatilis]KAA0970478.1 triose-phosphate isomerase [Aureimonas fodinaquatilis]
MAVRKLIAGNWKMNGLKAGLAEIAAVRDAVESGSTAHVDVLLCPPATLLAAACETAATGLAIGGQDCHTAQSGAFTGDISAAMVADSGASHVLVGHSERRTLHGEDDATVRAKAQAAWNAGLVAVVCIGETQAERDAGTTLQVLERQLRESLADEATAANCTVAYEPVWAIGTGLTPTVDDVADAHRFMREKLVERFGESGADFRILYGGSVKPDNAAELLSVANVDGALVGGASLKSADFIAICKAVRAE